MHCLSQENIEVDFRPGAAKYIPKTSYMTADDRNAYLARGDRFMSNSYYLKLGVDIILPDSISSKPNTAITAGQVKSGTASTTQRPTSSAGRPAATAAPLIPTMTQSFNRVMLIFPYYDRDTWRTITTAIQSINMAALPSLYTTTIDDTVTPTEPRIFDADTLLSVESGQCAVLTGFILVDKDGLVSVMLEGTNAAIQQFMQAYPKSRVNDDEYRYISNTKLTFSQRLYTSFGPDLKR